MAPAEDVLADPNPYSGPKTVVPKQSPSVRFLRANRWAVRALFTTGIPALLITFPVLLHEEFGIPVPDALRFFKPQTPLVTMYPELIAFPSAILAWIASWVLPIDERDWTPRVQDSDTPL